MSVRLTVVNWDCGQESSREVRSTDVCWTDTHPTANVAQTHMNAALIGPEYSRHVRGPDTL